MTLFFFFSLRGLAGPEAVVENAGASGSEGTGVSAPAPGMACAKD
jgi:hypothetical protein